MNTKTWSRKVLVIFVMTIFLTFTAMTSLAQAQPTAGQVKNAITKGVDWLAGQQNEDGSWVLGLSSPFDVANPYKSNIEAGLNYLFNNCAFTKTIDQQEAGDPDTNNNDLGVYWESSASCLHHRTYTSAIALMAICEAVELNRVIGGSGPLTGWTYEQVARDTMDYLAWGQMDYSYYGGGLD